MLELGVAQLCQGHRHLQGQLSTAPLTTPGDDAGQEYNLTDQQYLVLSQCTTQNYGGLKSLFGK